MFQTKLVEAKLTNTKELTTKADLMDRMVPWDYANFNAEPRNTIKNNAMADSKNLPKTDVLKDTTTSNELEETTELEETAKETKLLEETSKLEETSELEEPDNSSKGRERGEPRLEQIIVEEIEEFDCTQRVLLPQQANTGARARA